MCEYDGLTKKQMYKKCRELKLSQRKTNMCIDFFVIKVRPIKELCEKYGTTEATLRQYKCTLKKLLTK